ncbi:MAG: arginine--tRNA ligase [Spirochaetes bacterium GWF1_51_8]|nr:MAG: arginine--tRNA ligase [Spirochaetes bacterium GWF1_51_8]
MRLMEKILEAELAGILKKIYPDFSDFSKLFVQKTGDNKFGDYQTNFAMTTAKTLGRKPVEIAREIADGFAGSEAVERAEVAGPGFLNLFLRADFLGGYIRGIGASPYDYSFVQRDGAVVVDYSSPNIAKRMHIGHLRSTVIGDAIKRIYRFMGYDVVGDNHLGDWGTQFGKLIVGYRNWLDRAAYEQSPIEELERIYVEFERRSENDPALAETARVELKKLQDGDPVNTGLWKEFIDLSLKEYGKIYTRMGVSFDTWYGESFYHGLMPGVVKTLMDKGIAKVSEDAVVVFFDESEHLPPCLVQKKDGAFLYATSDLACIKYRRENYKLNRIIYVTDDRQSDHFRQVFRVSELLGWNEPKSHVPFGFMKFADGMFSTRKGNVIPLDSLLEEAVKRARAVIDEKNPNLPEEEKDNVAERVGVGAVKYADLSKNRVSMVIFDWDKMLSFEGNTAPYLMYTYARIRSMLRKAEDAGKACREDAEMFFTEDAERSLALLLTQFPVAVMKAAETFSPNLIADYLFELCQGYNSFYNALPVLKEKESLMYSRLLLSERVSRILKTGLDILGVECVERM